MKYAVLGAAGQLGRDLCPRLAGEVVPLTRADADLTRRGSLRDLLDGLRPDVVINCAAYNLVDRAEDEPDAAFAVNAWAVRELAVACNERGTVLVHFSTDHVFGLDAARRTPYAEDDPPGPVSVYGLSKLSGEYLVRALCPRHFVVRTCGLYGARGSGGKGGNFVETMLRLAGERRSLPVVSDQVCTPTSTVDLASAVVSLLATGTYGLYHVTNAGACSWHEFARMIFELEGIEVDLTAISTAAFGAKARRPAYSVLGATAYRRLGLPTLRSWQEALAAYLAERRLRR
ncbi:MAG: dTDP-4-dehydrorhamnose reductase [Planctomycetes bacterium]|nr:dTDP-4-dehydrorhamnose reductase [Planctomycetota bacterium]